MVYTTNNSILKCESLDLAFGGNQVLKSFSFEQSKNEILGIIGPNGAGKSCIKFIWMEEISPS